MLSAPAMVFTTRHCLTLRPGEKLTAPGDAPPTLHDFLANKVDLNLRVPVLAAVYPTEGNHGLSHLLLSEGTVLITGDVAT